jgi:hypothetical protein
VEPAAAAQIVPGSGPLGGAALANYAQQNVGLNAGGMPGPGAGPNPQIGAPPVPGGIPGGMAPGAGAGGPPPVPMAGAAGGPPPGPPPGGPGGPQGALAGILGGGTPPPGHTRRGFGPSPNLHLAGGGGGGAFNLQDVANAFRALPPSKIKGRVWLIGKILSGAA